MNNKLIKLLKRIKLRDIFAVLIFIFLFPISLILRLYFKIFKKEIWLICESPNTASDNGYHFFKYVKEKHPEVLAYYVIKKNCLDYQKVKEYGNLIEWGSIKHWLYYLSAKYNISSQKGGNPNAALFYFLHVKLKLYNNRIFLQHGIIKDDLEWLYYKNTHFRKFICGAKKEYDYVTKTFGYPDGIFEYTGLARYDNLHNFKRDKKSILFIPTWREWLGKDKNVFAKGEDFLTTEFYKNWINLLNDKRLHEYIEKNHIKIYFYPHINMQKYLEYFNVKCPNIEIVAKNDIDIQSLLKTASLMVTDYSSVFFDFAYMKKPIIYYQFDLEQFRKNQYREGYFKYERDGFGKVEKDVNDVVNDIIKYIDNDYKVEDKYLKKMNDFFEIHDTNNCERIFKAIKSIKEG